MTRTVFHQPHYGLFTGPEDAAWIRKMSGRLDAAAMEMCKISEESLVELATLMTAEMGAFVAVFGVGVEIGEEDLEKVPVAVYYYTLVDSGRTHLDPIFVEPTRLNETIVPLPEWFP